MYESLDDLTISELLELFHNILEEIEVRIMEIS